MEQLEQFLAPGTGGTLFGDWSRFYTMEQNLANGAGGTLFGSWSRIREMEQVEHFFGFVHRDLAKLTILGKAHCLSCFIPLAEANGNEAFYIT
jgi:hypothetical protein